MLNFDRTQIQEVKKELISIFNYYNKKFNLNIKLIFEESQNNCCYTHGTRIQIDIPYILLSFENGENDILKWL